VVPEEESGAGRGKAVLTGKEQGNSGDPADVLGAGYVWKFMKPVHFLWRCFVQLT